ncbi:hypothetical protein FZC33_27565 [Labrys sp. KNU-23]|uniref:hypothetical protein n=1 Tax=Labrys sp. KNU-23 TaxID=2789216 RepID=UPI0011EEBF88|nr:hypothetical protein [Labrys sp. KNU-23]QEN89839.1 hypothetical protein FZC33_27565 [Labrys sp. KNU-23]
MKLWSVSAVVLVGLTAAGCVTSGLGTSRGSGASGAAVAVPSGRISKIDQFSYITPTCREVPGVAARVTKQAAYGRVSIRRARDFSPYDAGNSSAGCNSQRVPVWQVLYTSAPGYQGPDHFAYRKAFPNGKVLDVVVNVDVQ